jgi:Peptidase A4 family
MGPPRPDMRWRSVSLAAVALAALAAAPAALADSTQSSNWAGYAVHRSGVHFRDVSGSWTQPQATCTPGKATYSSVWVGIGGYALDSPALEQIGTEADCTASGRAVSSAWFELVPSASRAVRLTIGPGDRVRAAVTVNGSEVTLSLADLTRHRTFTKRVRASAIDTTSAEWILEAPSVCSRNWDCHTLPLADFGSAGFTSAHATTTTGHRGTIQDDRWRRTRISLAATGRTFVSHPTAPSATAVPSLLEAQGSSFTVTYRGGTTSVGATQSAQMTSDRLVRPGLSSR